MATFRYLALDSAGNRTSGVVAAPSEAAAVAELESKSLLPISVGERRERRRVARRISARRLGTSYQQLGDLLRAGVPILRSLRVLGQGTSSPRLAAVYQDLAEQVSRGEELADAMSAHPEIFAKVHVAMVKAGERGGFLETVLMRLGQFVLAEADLRSKVVGNMIYPTVLIVFGSGVLGVVFGIFVPMFRSVVFKTGTQPPFITKVVFAASDAVAKFGPLTLALAVVAGIALWRLSRRPAVRRRLAVMRSSAPLLGPLVRSLAAARFCRMLGTMLGNGIPMLTAMQIARQAAGNLLMEEAIEKATESVRAGEPLAGPLALSGQFEPDILEMIGVAEASSNLDEILVGIADTVEARVDRMLNVLVRLIEPLMIVAIASVVALVAAGLLLPLTRFSANL